MAQDPYGNDVVDPFDQAIADAVMRSTWWSSGSAVFFSLASGCCCGVMGAANFAGIAGILPVILLALVSLAAAVNTLLRVFTMQPEHKTLVPSWHPIGALLVALAGALIALTELAITLGPFILMAVYGVLNSMFGL